MKLAHFLFAILAYYLDSEAVSALETGRKRSSDASSFPYGSGTCSTALVPVSINAPVQHFASSVTKPKTQLDVASDVTLQLEARSNFTTQALIPASKGGVTYQNQTWRISITTCYPKGTKWNGAVQVLVHGIGIDHRYWNSPESLPSSDFVKTVLNAGYAVVYYDRLGAGKSDHPDGLKTTQTWIEVEILSKITSLAKANSAFKGAKTWIGVGHSFGSVQMTGIAARHPKLFNKMVLTGYSSFNGSQPQFFFGYQPTIASQQNKTKFARYSNDTSYWVSASPSSDLMSFLYPPIGVYVSQAEANFLQEIKNPLAQGEALTMSQPASELPAKKFTGDVIVVSGKQDMAFCGGDCYRGPNGANILQDVKMSFPAARKFSTYTPDHTGHALNVHTSAPQSFATILAWLNGTYN